MDRGRPDSGVGGGQAQAPRKAVSSKLGGLARGLLKGAAMIGLAAGLIVGGGYVVKDVAPQLLNQIEAPAVPGGVQDPSLPGGQAPPVEVDVVPPGGTHEMPLPPAGGVQVDPAPGGATGGLPTPPVTTLPTFDPTEVKPEIPSHGGQQPSDIIRGTGSEIPGTVQSPVRGVPGLTDDSTGTTTGTLQEKPPIQTEVKPPIEPAKPPLSQQPTLDVKPADGQGATTDPLKATLRDPQGVVQPQIDTTRLPTFKPHMLRGQ